MGTVSCMGTSFSYLQLLLTCADFELVFLLDVQIGVLVSSKMKPSRTDLSVSSALNSA